MSAGSFAGAVISSTRSTAERILIFTIFNNWQLAYSI